MRLGVDVGSVRVGLASSDPDGLIATPVQTLARDPRGADLQAIAAEVDDRAVIEVLVGLPRSLSGGEGPAAALAREYAAALATLVEVPVRMVDERLSTVAATRSLRESGVPGRRQRSKVDQQAAVVLLQTALDTERASGRPPGSPVRVSSLDRGDQAGQESATGGVDRDA